MLAPKLTAAFMEGLHRGCIVAAATAIVVAVIVFWYLPEHQSAAQRGARFRALKCTRSALRTIVAEYLVSIEPRRRPRRGDN